MNSVLTVDEQTQVRHLIRQAGQTAKRLRRHEFQVIEKGPKDYVTSIDRHLDELVSQQFQQWFPQDAIISEENTLSVKLWQEQRSRFWLIDPIDGTNDFIHAHQHYSVMVGLLQDQQPVMGWIYAPESDRMFYGGTGLGGVFSCEGDGEPVAIIPKPPTNDAIKVIISEKDERRYGDAVLAAVPDAEFYSLGSFGLKVMEVVLGNASLYIYLNRRVKLWDTVGPLAVAKAAGLICCDLQGHPIEFEPHAIDPQTLAHYQVILVGWAEHIHNFRPHLQAALSNINSFGVSLK